MKSTEFHLPCDPKEISRYVFCPGDQARARKIADHFQHNRLVLENRGYIVFSGLYEGVPMTVIGTGMGGLTSLMNSYDILLERGPSRISPHMVTMIMPNGPAAIVGLEVGRASCRERVYLCV